MSHYGRQTSGHRQRQHDSPAVARVQAHAHVEATQRLSITHHLNLEARILGLQVCPQGIGERGHIMYHTLIQRLQLEATATRLDAAAHADDAYDAVHMRATTRRL